MNSPEPQFIPPPDEPLCPNCGCPYREGDTHMITADRDAWGNVPTVCHVHLNTWNPRFLGILSDTESHD